MKLTQKPESGSKGGCQGGTREADSPKTGMMDITQPLTI
jgi:hypothetical protein